MADSPESKEAVALALARQIVPLISRSMGNDNRPATKEMWLDLYAECLRAVQGDRTTPE